MRSRGSALRYSGDFTSDKEEPEPEEEEEEDDDDDEMLSSSGRGRRGGGSSGRRRQRGGGRGSKSSWLPHEDELLMRLVREHGQSNWSLIAKHFQGRIGKQCRERWHNQLRPDIKRDAWDAEEERLLIEAHRRIGNKWADIAKMIPGRTENAVKNHWNATLRRKDCGPRGGPDGRGNTLLKEYMKAIGVGSGASQHSRQQQQHAAGWRPPTKRRAASLTSASGSDEEDAAEELAATMWRPRPDRQRLRTSQAMFAPPPAVVAAAAAAGATPNRALCTASLYGGVGQQHAGSFGSSSSGFCLASPGVAPDSQQQLLYVPAQGQQTTVPILGGHAPHTGTASVPTGSASGSQRRAATATHLVFSPISSAGQAAGEDVKALSHEFDLMLHRQQVRRPSSSGAAAGGSAAKAAAAAAAVAAAGGAGIKRDPPSTPELDNIMDWLTSVNGRAEASPSVAVAKQLMLPIPADLPRPTTAPSSSPAAAMAAARSGTGGGVSLGPEHSLRDAFKTPEIPMLGVSLFSPQTQSQLDFTSLGGDLLLEVGHDPLGLLSPLQRQHQLPHFRPSSGLSSVKPAPLLHTGSSAALASAAPGRLSSAAYSGQAQTASSVHRRSDKGETSFLRSPTGVPALFKSPEEQRAASPHVQQQQQQQQFQQRRGSLFSASAAFAQHNPSPLAGTAAAAVAGSSVGAVAGAAAGAASVVQQPGCAPAQGRNLVVVQMSELASVESYLRQLHCMGMEVATYSGSVPGLAVERAVPVVPEAAAGLRQRLLEVVSDFCASIRGQAGWQALGDMLVALRLGLLREGETGLIVAMAAPSWPLAEAAVHQAVAHLRSIELQ